MGECVPLQLQSDWESVTALAQDWLSGTGEIYGMLKSPTVFSLVTV